MYYGGEDLQGLVASRVSLWAFQGLALRVDSAVSSKASAEVLGYGLTVTSQRDLKAKIQQGSYPESLQSQLALHRSLVATRNPKPGLLGCFSLLRLRRLTNSMKQKRATFFSFPGSQTTYPKP